MEAGVNLAQLYAECMSSSGRHPACEKFFKAFGPFLEKIAYRVAAQFRCREEADDLIQEISLKFAKKDAFALSSVPQDPAASIAYFSVVAANAARDYFRSRNAAKRGFDRTVPIEDSLALVTGGVVGQADRELLISEIESFLPPDSKSQTVFRLYFRQGFSAKEIAAIPALDLSVKGVESLIHRTILYVRERLTDLREQKAHGGGHPA